MLNRGPNPNSGTSAASNWLRRVWQAVQANKILPGVGYKVKYSSLGTTLEVNPGRGGTTSNAATKRYRVIAVYGDYLSCKTWDGTTLGDTAVNIAKPPHLRHSLTSQTIDSVAVTFGGHSITGGLCYRTASASGYDTQDEYVLPVYQLGSGTDSEILAVRPIGGTGVVVSEVELEWEDINVDARAWCQEYPTE